jgi:hypothetical protein
MGAGQHAALGCGNLTEANVGGALIELGLLVHAPSQVDCVELKTLRRASSAGNTLDCKSCRSRPKSANVDDTNRRNNLINIVLRQYPAP